MGLRSIVLLLIIVKCLSASDEYLSNHNVNSTAFARSLSFAGNELLYLSELPLEQLLKVKKSLGELRQASVPAYHGDNELKEDVLESRMIGGGGGNFFQQQQPNALALNEDQRINKKYDSLDPWDSKPSKVQTFFQISITALAFLAFAAYLLCMIVQAIKSKGTMFMYPSSMSMTSGTNAANSLLNQGSVPLRKRRPLGRRRRNVFLSSDNQNATNLLEDAIATPDPSEMYRVMIQCAESYTRFYFIQ